MMQSAYSISAYKGNDAYFVEVDGISIHKRELFFQVDSGASRSLVGLNSVCGNDHKAFDKLKHLLEEIVKTGRYESKIMRTVTKEKVEVYPCVMRDVTIMDSRPLEFYFYIYPGIIHLPLLGFDFIDDCSFSHTIAGDVSIMSMANDPGKRFYPDKVLDLGNLINKL